MGKFSLYNIQLQAISEGTSVSFEYELDNDFFRKIDSPEVQEGRVSVILDLKRTLNVFELEFKLDGIVTVTCDRCLDDMEQAISYKGKLFVKFGADFSQEGDDVVIVPESEGEINIAWFLYEFIVLSIPSKHIHEAGKCNKTVASKLRKHLITSRDDEKEDDDDNETLFIDNDNDDFDTKEQTTDPRWDALKDIF